MRAKEFLSARGVEFQSINVVADPDGLAEMTRLGARSLPVIAVGEDFVIGQSARDIARLVGIEGQFGPELPPAELVSRLDTFIRAAQRFQRQIPDANQQESLPGRPRPLRVLAHHMYLVPAAFLVAARGGQLSKGLTTGRPTDDMATFDDIAAFGETVRADVQDWWCGLDDKTCSAPVDTYFGQPSMHEMLERTTWHVGQHCRQLMWYLDQTLGIAPQEPLGPADFQGLPIPENVWDE